MPAKGASMFSWMNQRNRRQTKPNQGERRPLTFQPQIEALESRWLPSASGLPSSAAVAPSHPGLTDTVQGHETAWHLVVDAIVPTYTTTFAGTATGTLPGTFSATIPYRGQPGLGTTPIVAGGEWRGWTTSHRAGSQPALSGSFTGGSIVWDPSGLTANVRASLSIKTNTQSVTGPASFAGRVAFSGNNFHLTGTLIAGSSQSTRKTGTPSSPSTPKAATTTALAATPGSSLFGQPVMLRATVKAPRAGTPAGTVTFFDGSKKLGTARLSKGQATFTTSTLAVGSHTLKAVYSGSNADVASTSAGHKETIKKDATTTALATTPSSSLFGQSVTLKATVKASAPGAGTPTGTVTFFDGSKKLGTARLSKGQATFTTSTLAVGSHTLKAVYSGSNADVASTSAGHKETVKKDATRTALNPTAKSSLFGRPLTLRATVKASAPGAGTPTGMVTFYDGSKKLGTGKLSKGQATFTTSTLAVGNHTLKAVYGGDGHFVVSTASTRVLRKK